MDSGNFDVLSVDKPWLMLGDCLERMREIPDGSVDAIICDLPYGSTACKWDNVIPFDPLWIEYKRLIKRNGAIVLTASQPFTTKLISSNFEMYKYSWVWVKTKCSDFINAKNKPMKKHEDICVFSSGATANRSTNKMPYYPQDLVYNPGFHSRKAKKFKNGDVVGERPSHVSGYVREWENYPSSVLEFGNANYTKEHPTQKPVALMEYLVKTYTNPGEVILDNCFGSGTTGVACAQTGRRFIGIEKHEPYFHIARRRIDAAIASTQPAPQGGLFETELI